MFNLPFLLYADLNCTPEDVTESSWLSLLFAQIILASGPTSKQSDRIIDFMVRSAFLFQRFSAIRLVHKVPSGPHFGMLLDMAATPLLVTCLKQSFPKGFPFIESKLEWNTLSDF